MVTSSSATSAAWSPSAWSGGASCQPCKVSRTNRRAAAGAVGVGASRSSSRRYRGRSEAASRASWRVGYSGRKCGTLRRPRSSATAGWAPHSSTLVAGQRLAGWLATVAKMVAHTGSMASTPLRSQMSANGRSARDRPAWRAGRHGRVGVVRPPRRRDEAVCCIAHPTGRTGSSPGQVSGVAGRACALNDPA
jgi:hypothetical protein